MLQVYISKKKQHFLNPDLKKSSQKTVSYKIFTIHIPFDNSHKNGFHIFAHFIDNRKIEDTNESFEKNFSNREFNSHLHSISRIENIFDSLVYLLSRVINRFTRRQSTERERKRGGLNIRRQRGTRNKNYESLEAILHFKRESPRRMLGGQNSRRLLEIGRVNKILI